MAPAGLVVARAAGEQLLEERPQCLGRWGLTPGGRVPYGRRISEERRHRAAPRGEHPTAVVALHQRHTLGFHFRPETEVRRAGTKLDEVVERLDVALAVEPPCGQLFELAGGAHPRHRRLAVDLEPDRPLLDHGRVGEHAAAAITRLARGVSLDRSEEHTSELQSRSDLVCRLLLEKKK